MTAAYRFTPRARDGLGRIVRYVQQQFGGEVAERVLTEFERAFESLVTSPEIGHRREDLTSEKSVRFWSVGPTLIAYRAVAQGIEILFVERADVDWERMLETCWE